MATFYIPQLKLFLPILKECYGFDIIEISNELAESLRSYYGNDRRMDEIALEQLYEGKKRNVLLDKAINIDRNVEICTTDDFSGQIAPIEDLCNQHIENEDMRTTAKFILVFMAAIFNRETNNKNNDDTVKRLRKNWNKIHSDSLRLFIALNKSKPEGNTPIRICYKTDSPHLINNQDSWFSDFLNNFAKYFIGDITVEKAEEELKRLYSDNLGRKSSNPYLNYIIHGTYNFITRFLTSEDNIVTAQQCRFLLEYLKIIGQIKDSDTNADLNTLQSTVRSLIKGQLTPVDKYIKEIKFI